MYERGEKGGSEEEQPLVSRLARVSSNECSTWEDVRMSSFPSVERGAWDTVCVASIPNSRGVGLVYT